MAVGTKGLLKTGKQKSTVSASRGGHLQHRLHAAYLSGFGARGSPQLTWTLGSLTPACPDVLTHLMSLWSTAHLGEGHPRNPPWVPKK